MLLRAWHREKNLYEAMRVRELQSPGFHYYQMVLCSWMGWRIEILKGCKEIIIFCASWNVQPTSWGGISPKNCTETSQWAIFNTQLDVYSFYLNFYLLCITTTDLHLIHPPTPPHPCLAAPDPPLIASSKRVKFSSGDSKACYIQLSQDPVPPSCLNGEQGAWP